MKALVRTTRDGYQLYRIVNKDDLGYYLYNKTGGIWYVFSNRVRVFSKEENIENIKDKHPEYFL